MIAHRLSTICRADLILLMEDGRVLEWGTHEELIAPAAPITAWSSARRSRTAKTSKRRGAEAAEFCVEIAPQQAGVGRTFLSVTPDGQECPSYSRLLWQGTNSL